MELFQITLEEDILQKKSCTSQKLKVFIIKYYDISKIYSVQFHLFCLVNLSYIYFLTLGFQSLILHQLKITLNCRLKLNDDNNQLTIIGLSGLLTFLVLTNHNYLIYKNKQK